MSTEIFMELAENEIIDEVGTVDGEIIDEVEVGNKLPKGARRNEDGSVTLRLMNAVEVQIRDQTGKVRVERYDSLTFHHLTGADLRAIRAAKTGDEHVVSLARSTRISTAIMNHLFDKMHIGDITAAGDVMESFLKTGR